MYIIYNILFKISTCTFGILCVYNSTIIFFYIDDILLKVNPNLKIINQIIFSRSILSIFASFIEI
jgi:hypothetical protein